MTSHKDRYFKRNAAGVASVLIFEVSIFPIFSSCLTRSYEAKKQIVLYLHMVSSCATLFFALLQNFKDEFARDLEIKYKDRILSQ